MIPAALGRALVVDASVALKWFFTESDSEAALALVRGADDRRIDLHAPDHWLAEVANAVWVRCRSQGAEGISHADARHIVGALRSSDVRLHPLPPVIDLALEIAIAADASMYDALYVATAERLDLPFVTADRRLLRKLNGTPWAERAVELG